MCPFEAAVQLLALHLMTSNPQPHTPLARPLLPPGPQCQLERALSRGEALAADKQRSQAERDGLAAELRCASLLHQQAHAHM
jgi:hypothetical protein